MKESKGSMNRCTWALDFQMRMSEYDDWSTQNGHQSAPRVDCYQKSGLPKDRGRKKEPPKGRRAGWSPKGMPWVGAKPLTMSMCCGCCAAFNDLFEKIYTWAPEKSWGCRMGQVPRKTNTSTDTGKQKMNGNGTRMELEHGCRKGVRPRNIWLRMWQGACGAILVN